MATDEEIRQEADKLVEAWRKESSTHIASLSRESIKKGMQMERERLRKQVKRDESEFGNGMGGFLDAILIDEIDIWDDVK